MSDEQAPDLATLTHWATYVYTAMAQAVYEILPDGEGIYAEVPGFQGVWGHGATFDECRAELLSVLEDWIAIRLKDGLDLPALAGLAPPAAA
jgi:predicted RNase H-like HicB family nuclease